VDADLLASNGIDSTVRKSGEEKVMAWRRRRIRPKA